MCVCMHICIHTCMCICECVCVFLHLFGFLESSTCHILMCESDTECQRTWGTLKPIPVITGVGEMSHYVHYMDL